MRLFLTSLVFMTSNAVACPALLNRTMDSLLDEPTSLCQYAGKVVLVVNTASQCG